MAITIISQPDEHNTAYNLNEWVFNSTNKALPGFRYVVVIKNNFTGNVIYTELVPPRPDDGYGQIKLTKILQTFLEAEINFDNQNNNLYSQSTKFKLSYKIEFGEEYVQSWPYNDTEFVSGGNMQCRQFPTITTHPFIVGDSINIIPTNPLLVPSFQGLYNVTAVPDAYTIITSGNYVGSVANPGTVTFSDNRKTRYSNVTTSPIKYVYNSVIDFSSWPSYSLVTENITPSITTKLFTNWKDGFYINNDQDLYWPFEYNGAIVLHYKRNDGAEFTKTVPNRTTTENTRYVNVAPKANFTTGTGDLFTDDIKWYDFWITNTVGPATQLTRKYRINVQNRCKSSDWEILFVDRMGGFCSYAFEALNSKSFSVDKEQYNRAIDTSNSTYDPRYTRGTSNITVNLDEKFTLRTKAIPNRDQYRFFEEMISSGDTWIKIHGTYQRVDILTKSDNSKFDNQSGLRYRTIEVQMANKNIINY